MSYLLYLLLFIISIILGLVIVLIVLYRKNNHGNLYNEGVCNENDGRYDLALDNYEDALSEIRKLAITNKFEATIAQRIKILRTTIDYEKNFQTDHGA